MDKAEPDDLRMDEVLSEGARRARVREAVGRAR